MTTWTANWWYRLSTDSRATRILFLIFAVKSTFFFPKNVKTKWGMNKYLIRHVRKSSHSYRLSRKKGTSTRHSIKSCHMLGRQAVKFSWICYKICHLLCRLFLVFFLVCLTRDSYITVHNLRLFGLPLPPVSMFLVLKIRKICHFLTPSSPYKCLRNIWMVPKECQIIYSK